MSDGGIPTMTKTRAAIKIQHAYGQTNKERHSIQSTQDALNGDDNDDFTNKECLTPGKEGT